MDNAAKAQAEYERLRSLTGGRNPYSDCQLVALMIARAIGGDIIDGGVTCKSGKHIWHFWAHGKDTCVYDPLAEAWKDDQPHLYLLRRYVEEEEVLGELERFVKSIDYIPHNYKPVFPLRYVLADELLGAKIPDIERLSL